MLEHTGLLGECRKFADFVRKSKLSGSENAKSDEVLRTPCGFYLQRADERERRLGFGDVPVPEAVPGLDLAAERPVRVPVRKDPVPNPVLGGGGGRHFRVGEDPVSDAVAGLDLPAERFLGVAVRQDPVPDPVLGAGGRLEYDFHHFR